MAVQTEATRVTAAAPRRRFERSLLLVGAFGLVLAFLVISPLAALFYGAFLNAAPGQAGTLSLDAFAEAWSDPAAWVAAWTSIWLAVARMSTVIPITIFLAWAITRTNMPM